MLYLVWNLILAPDLAVSRLSDGSHLSCRRVVLTCYGSLFSRKLRLKHCEARGHHAQALDGGKVELSHSKSNRPKSS